MNESVYKLVLVWLAHRWAESEALALQFVCVSAHDWLPVWDRLLPLTVLIGSTHRNLQGDQLEFRLVRLVPSTHHDLMTKCVESIHFAIKSNDLSLDYRLLYAEATKCCCLCKDMGDMRACARAHTE